jgi:hypothetical protein
VVKDAAPSTANRVVCYCDDCQAFLHHLGRADLLDAHGGTDIIQIAPASLQFIGGEPRIVGLRLTPRGLYRWYASCCGTPLGNMVSPAIPFVGIVAQAFASDGRKPDDVFGPPIGAIYGRNAVDGAPGAAAGLSARLVARALPMVLGWRLRGRAWPHPFFQRSPRAPRFPVATLSRSEREALRRLCGPHPDPRAASRPRR